MPLTRQMAKKENKCFPKNIKKSINRKKKSKKNIKNSTNSKKTNSIDHLLSLCRPVSVRLERLVVKNIEENKTDNGKNGNI